MTILDDPMLALIVRFVAGNKQIGASDDDFLRRQVEAVRRHIALFPEEERNHRAMEWIRENAERYRREWRRDAIVRQMSGSRCVDCPLIHSGDARFCDIHQQWIGMLRRYLNDEISSADYVHEGLALLESHKDRLKVAVLESD